MSLTDRPGTLAAFDRVCAAVTSKGHGVTLPQLATAHRLARALVADDVERIRDLAAELGLDPQQVVSK